MSANSLDASFLSTGVPAWVVIAYLPLVGFAMMAVSFVFFVLGQGSIPKPFTWAQLLLGVVYLVAFYTDVNFIHRTRSGWWPNRRLWCVAGLLFGGSIFLAPIPVIIYLRKRRRALGRPHCAWVDFVRDGLRRAGAAAEQYR